MSSIASFLNNSEYLEEAKLLKVVVLSSAKLIQIIVYVYSLEINSFYIIICINDATQVK